MLVAVAPISSKKLQLQSNTLQLQKLTKLQLCDIHLQILNDEFNLSG